MQSIGFHSICPSSHWHALVHLDTTLPLEENLRRVTASDYARYPVCRDGLDEGLGILGSKRLLSAMLSGTPPGITESLLPAVFVPESLSGLVMWLSGQLPQTGDVLV